MLLETWIIVRLEFLVKHHKFKTEEHCELAAEVLTCTFGALKEILSPIIGLVKFRTRRRDLRLEALNRVALH